MARSVAQWKQVIIQEIQARPAITALANNTSAGSITNLIAYAVAYCAWTLEVLFERHRSDVSTDIRNLRAHKASWYRDKVLGFQFGHDLVPETDQYDNSGLTQDEIDQSKIIKYCAVTQAADESRLIIKVATEDGSGNLSPISQAQYDALKAYVERWKDAGNFITIINYLPDRLYLTMDIYYDPLLITSEGASILEGGKPVETALQEFRRELPFDGELILMNLVDKLQEVEGVEIPHLRAAGAAWIDPDQGTYGDQELFSVKHLPRSGYYEIPNFDNINYLPNV